MCAEPNIVVVESSSVRNLIGTVLEKEHYNAQLEDAAGALELLRRQDVQIDLLITNEPWWFVPFRPGMRVLYISGAPDSDFLRKHRNESMGYLQKPFRFHELMDGVRTLLGEPARVS